MSCAFLGPEGSYTSQAVSQLLPSHPLEPFSSIQEVYNANTPYAVLPIENTIHGVVQETLGCLLSDETRRWKVRGTLDMGIQHALVMSEGTEKEDVRWVASHEQVRSYGSSRFPVLKLFSFPGSRTMHRLPTYKLSKRKTRTSAINSTSSTRLARPLTPSLIDNRDGRSEHHPARSSPSSRSSHLLRCTG